MSTQPVAANPLAPTESLTETTWPDGSVLTSSALTLLVMSETIQQLTAQMLGLNPQTNPQAYANVRLEWPTGGQPGFGIAENIAFIRVIEDDDDYNRIRNQTIAPSANGAIAVTTTYARVWRVFWTLYGPNSFDSARLIRTALFADVFHDALAMVNLYLVTDVKAPTRVPDLFDGQWWERSDFTVQLNEGVTETITAPSMASVQIVLSGLGTQRAGFGSTPFGSGDFGDQVTIGTDSNTITVQE